MMRHLPPTAVPVHAHDLRRGLSALGKPEIIRQDFHEAVSAYIGASHCFLLSSGRAGLYLILMALRRISARTHVIVPAYTCPTVVQAVLKAGLQVRLCDLSINTLGMDRKALEKLIDESVLAIVAVHPFGLLEDVNDLVALGHQEEIFIIEDAAQSLGAKVGGRMVGNWGDFGLFSLGRGKVMTTGGGGVVVTTNDLCASAFEQVITKEIRFAPRAGLVSLAYLAAYWFAMHPLIWWFIARTPLNPADKRQDMPPPFSVGLLSTVQVGVGRSMMASLDQMNEARRRNAALLIDALKSLPLVCIPAPVVSSRPVYLRLPVLINDKALREQLFRQLYQNGIGVSRMYEHALSEIYANHLDPNSKKCPSAEYIARHILTLPTHHYVDKRDIQKTIEIFYDGRPL